MMRLVIAGLGVSIALGAGAVIVPSLLASNDPVEVASLDPNAVVENSERSGFSKVVGSLPFIGDKEPPMTRARALANRDALRREPLNSFMPEEVDGWERLEWNMFFEGRFGPPDNAINVEREAAVYIKDKKSIYLRIENGVPSGPMVADLLQMQRYVEKGGDISDLKDYRPTVEHTIEAVRTTSDGWSIDPTMTFGHFEIIEGVSFIVGKFNNPRHDFADMRFYHGALGGGVVIKMRSNAPFADVVSVLEGIDYDSLNIIQDVPHPLVGAGLPEFVIETPEEWLANKGFKLRKVERVIPAKEEPVENPEDNEADAGEAENDKDKGKGDKKEKKGH